MFLFILGVGAGVCICGAIVIFAGHQELEKHKRRQLEHAQRKLRRKR